MKLLHILPFIWMMLTIKVIHSYNVSFQTTSYFCEDPIIITASLTICNYNSQLQAVNLSNPSNITQAFVDPDLCPDPSKNLVFGYNDQLFCVQNKAGQISIKQLNLFTNSTVNSINFYYSVFKSYQLDQSKRYILFSGLYQDYSVPPTGEIYLQVYDTMLNILYTPNGYGGMGLQNFVPLLTIGYFSYENSNSWLSVISGFLNSTQAYIIFKKSCSSNSSCSAALMSIIQYSNVSLTPNFTNAYNLQYEGTQVIIFSGQPTIWIYSNNSLINSTTAISDNAKFLQLNSTCLVEISSKGMLKYYILTSATTFVQVAQMEIPSLNYVYNYFWPAQQIGVFSDPANYIAFYIDLASMTFVDIGTSNSRSFSHFLINGSTVVFTLNYLITLELNTLNFVLTPEKFFVSNLRRYIYPYYKFWYLTLNYPQYIIGVDTNSSLITNTSVPTECLANNIVTISEDGENVFMLLGQGNSLCVKAINGTYQINVDYSVSNYFFVNGTLNFINHIGAVSNNLYSSYDYNTNMIYIYQATTQTMIQQIKLNLPQSYSYMAYWNMLSVNETTGLVDGLYFTLNQYNSLSSQLYVVDSNGNPTFILANFSSNQVFNLNLGFNSISYYNYGVWYQYQFSGWPVPTGIIPSGNEDSHVWLIIGIISAVAISGLLYWRFYKKKKNLDTTKEVPLMAESDF